MSAVARFDQLVEQLVACGYLVRFENLGGTGGGACEYAGKRVFFVDLSLSLLDQIDQLQNALAAAGPGVARRVAA
jgi:hypothetical protein